ncbi:MAG: hypothetical protein BGN86_06955 [Caulobacterales bacterium 68-7]|nr:MAG: hypothetical protein BGN86_06955 [Caulobacterales bacterium 68-7]
MVQRRVVAELPGWGVVAELPVSELAGRRLMNESELNTAAAITLVNRGILSQAEADAVTLRLEPPRRC